MSLFDDLDAQNEVEKSPYRPAFNQGNVVEGPDGEDLSLPPNTGAANLYGGATSPASHSPRPKKNLFLELDAMEENRGPVEGTGDGDAQAPSMMPKRRMIPVGSVNPFDKLDGITPSDDLPQVRDSVADSIGLQRWRDVNDGMEIRRAQPATKRIPEQGSEMPSWAGRNPFETAAREFATAASTSTDNALAGAMRSTAGQIQSNTSLAKEKLAGLEASLAKAQEAGNQDEIQMFSRDIDSARKEVASLEQADQEAATGTGPLDKIRRAVRGLDHGAKEALQKGAEFFTEKAKSDREFYDTKPNDDSVSAQVGRGFGNVASMTPTMVIPGGAGLAITALQGASASYNEAYEATREQLQKAGVSDEKTIDDASSQAGSTAATKTFPALAAYMVGGKITAAGVSALLKGAAPLVKGIVGGTAASGANVITSAGIRVAEGEDWKPTAEGLTQDVAFGAIHGAGEYNQAKANPGQEAQRFDENAGQTRSFSGDNSQNRQNPVKNATKPAENTPSKATEGNDWTTATDPEEGEQQAPITSKQENPSLVSTKEDQDSTYKSADLNSGLESPDGKYGENNPVPQNRKQVESTIKGLDNGEYHIYIDGEHEYTLHVITSKNSGKRSYQLESPVNGHSLGIGTNERLGDVASSLMWQSATTQNGERIWSKPELYKAGTTPGAAKTEPPIEQKITPTPSEEAMQKHGLAWADPKTLKLSEDVPNFKEGADEKTGIVEADRLKGKYDPEAAGILHVWERLDGTREIISGRHRWQLALENNTPEVLVKIHREADGFTKEDALTKDAQLNIKDEKGTTKDFAAYFRNDPITREEAEAGGLLSRVKQKAGFEIGRYSSGDLYGRFSAGKIAEAKAAAIARTAPNNDGLQRAGMDVANLMSAEEIPGFLKLLEQSKGPQEVQAGLFGEDDSAIQESIRISKAAAKKAEELQEQILAVKGASKRPEAAAKLGVNVQDPQGLQKKILDLSMQRERYRNFWQHPEIIQELSGKEAPKQEATAQQEAAIPTIEKNGEGNLFRGDEIEFNLTGETDRSSLTPEEQKAKALDEAMAAENEKNQGSLFDEEPKREVREASTETEAKERGEVADEEAKEFEEKQFPTTKEEVQAQLDSLSEKRQKESEAAVKTIDEKIEEATTPEEVNALVKEAKEIAENRYRTKAKQSDKDQYLKRIGIKASAKKKGLEDFGEKIGGARKDTATKGGRGASKPQDDRPGWARRYEILQIQAETSIGGGKEIDPFLKGRWIIRDLRNLDWMKQPKQVGRETYATKEDAEKVVPLIAVSRNHSVRMVSKTGEEKPVFQIWRKVTDRKMIQVIKEDFPSREAAMEYMAKHAKDIIEAKTAWREELIVKPENATRTGTERRQGPATPEMFQDTFGFRGVEFGNWMKQDTGSLERQEVLNNAYDGLKDLAEILGVPDKALSLNGDLGLAFGARGHGLVGAKAHYEPEYGVINLTKMSGAGSLAHEWFHAFDHYLARLDSKASASREKGGNGDSTYKNRGFVSEGFSRNSQVRPEVIEAFDSLMKTMRTKAVNFVEDSKKAEEFVATAKNRLEERLKALRDNLTREQQYGSKKAPATAKQLARFDELAGRLLDGDVKTSLRFDKDSKVKKSAKISGMRWSNDTLDALSDLWKEVRGRSGFKSDNSGVVNGLYSYVKNYHERIEMLKSASQEEVKTKAVPTSYRMEAAKIDQGSATDYWQTELELAARAFSSYVEDKIANGGARSEFLSYGSDNELPGYKMWGLKPFPEGEERLAINAAMDRLFRTLKTKETEKGVAFFSSSPEQGLTSETSPRKLFTFNEQQDPQHRGLFQSLERAINNNSGLSNGTNGGVRVRQVAISGVQSESGDNARRFISAFERLTGTKVWFIDTNQSVLSLRAARLQGDNKNIFVHVRSERPLDAMAWHEWAHIIEETNPKLYAELVDAVKKYSGDWEKAVSEINPEVYKKRSSQESEVVNNTLGDAFLDPGFWDSIKKHTDGTLFNRAYEAAKEWFSSLVDKARSAWGTESQSRDVKTMRDEIAKIIARSFPHDFTEGGDFNLGDRNPDAGGYPEVQASSGPQQNLLAAMGRHNAAPPLSMREKVASSLRRIKGVTKDLPEFGDFKREVLKWSSRSQRSANEILRVQGQIEEAVPSKEKRDGITNWIQANGDKGLLQSWANATKNKALKAGYEAALTLTPEEIATAKKIKDTYDVLHARAAKFGIDMGYLQNYVTELWKQEPQRAAGSSPKRLSEFFKFSQERVFPNYFEGEQAGYEPQTKDISKLLGLYMNEMNNAINSRRFVQELSKGTASDGRPLVSARGSGQEVGEDVGDKVHLVYPDKAAEGTEDYKKLDQPALHGWVFAGKDADGNMILMELPGLDLRLYL